MEGEIWVYGNPDKTHLGFPSPGDIERYISHDVFAKEDGRYRYTQGKNARIIVLSRDGKMYGHFEIEAKVKPNDKDRAAYPRVRFVYIVRKSVLYTNAVPLSTLSISGLSYGYKLSEEDFQTLQQLAGGTTEFLGEPVLPSSPVELERILQAVKKRLGQSEFRKALVSAYKGQCAVTHCNAVDSLEAAHLDPYSGIDSNDASNGILLRADIHTLFDLKLIGIEPDSRQLTLAERLRGTSYEKYHGMTVAAPDNPTMRPAKASLQRRWEEFRSA